MLAIGTEAAVSRHRPIFFSLTLISTQNTISSDVIHVSHNTKVDFDRFRCDRQDIYPRATSFGTAKTKAKVQISPIVKLR